MKNILVFLLPLLTGFTSIEQDELADLIHSQIEQGKRVIAFGEYHQHESLYTLLGKALRTQRVQKEIDVIVVEFGNRFYQEELDRYIEGADVSVDTIRPVWRNTTISPNTVWDSPVYEQFFKTVRDINISLPPNRKYRVVAGGESIDWSTIRSEKDLAPYKVSSRSRQIFDAMRIEVLAKNKKALLIAGGFHTCKMTVEFRNRAGKMIRDDTTGTLLERHYPGSTFFINNFSKLSSLGIGEFENVKIGSIVLASEPWLRDIGANNMTVFKRQNNDNLNGTRNYSLNDMTDAVIYWGPKESWNIAKPLKSTYQDEAYWQELNRRSLISRNRRMDESLRN